MSIMGEGLLVLICYGPSRLLHMPNKFEIVIAGMIGGKFFNAFGFNSMIPALTDACLEHFKLDQAPSVIADRVGVITKVKKTAIG